MHFADPKSDREALFSRPGTLLVFRPPAPPPTPAPGQPGVKSDYLQAHPDIFVAVLDSGQVLAFNGHVDLGTGIRTALAQIVAEELCVPFERVTMVLGHTEATPNQGPTIASASIQISAVPLRNAVAQAREYLIRRAVAHFELAQAEGVQAINGKVVSPDGRSIEFGALLSGPTVQLEYQAEVPLKDSSQYSIVGKSQPRVDIPAKATGQLTFVHDVRVPGMWHARVIRPPYIGRDGGEFIGHTLLSVDESTVAAMADDVKVVVKGDFVAVAARREEQAIKAMRSLKVHWKPVPELPPLDNLESALRKQDYNFRPLLDQDEAQENAEQGISLKRSYVWPYHMHGSVGPSCAVADYANDELTVWAGTQNPHMLRVELAQLVQLDEGAVNIVRYEASGCYGRNCADDVCADAALISKEIGHPVRVQLTREQEHGWEPKGAAQLIDIEGSLDTQGRLLSYDFITRYPSNDAPSLALILTGVRSNQPRTLQMGDRTSVPPYLYPRMKIASHDMAPIVRAAWLRGVSAMPNSFAHDSFIDELAHAANADPVAFRLQYLRESNARDVLAATARKANWQPGVKGSRGVPDSQGNLRGRGVAYARYVHSKFPGFGAAWSAWVVDVVVDSMGKARVEHLVVGQDTGMMVNPDGVRHQIHGNVIQSLSRVLKEEVKFNAQGVVDHEWGAYPIMNFTEIPPIEIVLMDRQDEPPMGAGESSSVPSGAAIANALFDATGVRYREAPFTPARILAGLAAADTHSALAEPA
tara:strand:- start:17801 stop:20071 length:2271 start_codon:yes stop_codon:yes gene_type:complete